MNYVSPSPRSIERQPGRLTYSFLEPIDIREETRELRDWVFVLGLIEEERSGLGRVVGFKS